VRQRESAHRKTQTPIVAKQVETEQGILHRCTHFMEFAVLPKIQKGYNKKGMVHPADEKTPCF